MIPKFQYPEILKFFKMGKLKKKNVNRDSHIASSPISRSYFFEEIHLLDFGFLTKEASWIHRIFKI